MIDLLEFFLHQPLVLAQEFRPVRVKLQRLFSELPFDLVDADTVYG